MIYVNFELHHPRLSVFTRNEQGIYIDCLDYELIADNSKTIYTLIV